MRIFWTPLAVDDLKALHPPLAVRLVERTREFFATGDGASPRTVHRDWDQAFQLRVGDWRVLCRLERHYPAVGASWQNEIAACVLGVREVG